MILDVDNLFGRVPLVRKRPIGETPELHLAATSCGQCLAIGSEGDFHSATRQPEEHPSCDEIPHNDISRDAGGGDPGVVGADGDVTDRVEMACLQDRLLPKRRAGHQQGMDEQRQPWHPMTRPHPLDSMAPHSHLQPLLFGESWPPSVPTTTFYILVRVIANSLAAE